MMYMIVNDQMIGFLSLLCLNNALLFIFNLLNYLSPLLKSSSFPMTAFN